MTAELTRKISNFIYHLCCTAFLGLCSYAQAQPYTLGQTYTDSTGFVTYMAGDLPVVLSAPHGGNLEPDSIPDRNCVGCVYRPDRHTQTITEKIYDAFYEQTGCYPHAIINTLHRSKFDANRDIDEAADGNPTVEIAWREYHRFIDDAKSQVINDYDRGLFLDIHGHGHSIQRIELGYLLRDSELRYPDEDINKNENIDKSAIKTLIGDNIQNYEHAELLRGPESFGSLMDNRTFPSVPSTNDPYPQVGEPYFRGGYNTVRHGSRDNNGDIDAIQIELNSDIRTDETRREVLIDSLTTTINDYIDLHYDASYQENYCALLLPVHFISFDVAQKNPGVEITWSTSFEFNHDHFVIERSNDGSTLQNIAYIKYSAPSNGVKKYAYLDTNAQEGINYYRIKQIDRDNAINTAA